MVMAHYATGLGPKFLMSILLPLAVVILYGRQAFADPTMQLAWVQFAFAASYTYLLAETRDPLAGNFAGPGVATYLLFVVSTVFVLRHRESRSRTVLCALAFGLHAASGAALLRLSVEHGNAPHALSRSDSCPVS